MGWSLEPVILALSRWGAGLLDAPREGEDPHAGWAAVALRSAVGTGVAGERAGTYELRIDGAAFHLRVGGGEDGAKLRQAPAQDPDLVVAGDAGTFLAVASGRLDPEEAVESGALRVEGDDGESPGALLRRCLWP
jgi:putative sterol carrier protein